MKKYFQNIVNIGLANQDEVFDYSGTPEEEECGKIVDFYQENLAHLSRYGCQPSYFIIRNKDTINALARKRGKNYLIAINHPVVRTLYTKYQAYFDFTEIEGLGHYRPLQSILMNSLHDLLYQSILHFNFYHEFGHLLQFKAEEDAEVQFTDDTEQFDWGSHLAEVDADCVSCYWCCSHLSQYLEEYTRFPPTRNQIQQYLSIAMAGILIYLIEFLQEFDKFFLKENKYPHPSVRVSNIMWQVVEHFEGLQIQRNVPTEQRINKLEVGRESRELIDILMKHFRIEDKYNTVDEQIKHNAKNIATYLHEVLKEVNRNPLSAINQRNKGI